MIYFAIDFETANYCRNSACSIGIVRFADGEEKDSVYSLIHPAKMYFRPDFIDIHHITYDDVRDKPYFPEVWQNLVEPFIKSGNEPACLIAHHARFDMDVLRSCIDYYGMPLPDIDYACTLKIARKTWPDFECHRLTFLAEQFGITYDAHNALDDARTCGNILTLAAQELNCSIEELLAENKINFPHSIAE